MSKIEPRHSMLKQERLPNSTRPFNALNGQLASSEFLAGKYAIEAFQRFAPSNKVFRGH